MQRALRRFQFRRELGELPTLDLRGSPPRVTVVMATYNRSNVLRYALESVCAQTFTDWEAFVVGDACSDDTADVVSSIGDPRLHYLDLPVNSGDQSGPNSVGARLARGDYVAWLSQDDLWFPDHLERLLDVVSDSGVDGAIAAKYVVRELGQAGLADPDTQIEITSESGPLRLTGHRNHPASTWLFSSATLARVGDWRRAKTVRYATSQEYLYRVWSSGAHILLSPTPTAVFIPSTVGSQSYGARRDREQAMLAPTVLAGGRGVFDDVARRTAVKPFRLPEGIGVLARNRSAVRRALARHSERLHAALSAPLARLGIAPWEFAGYLVGEVRGESDAVLRMIRGLPAPEGSDLSDALLNTLRAQLEEAEGRISELASELARAQQDYRMRDREFLELGDAYSRQSAELARTQQDYLDRDGELAILAQAHQALFDEFNRRFGD
jgi:hypothetical protein